MDDKHRLLKWLLIVFLVASALLVLYPPQQRLKGGIDLVGGTSLLFEIDTAGMKGEQKRDLATRVIDILRNRVDPNNQMNLVWRPIGNSRIEVQMPRPPAEALERRQAYEEARQAIRAQNATRMDVESALNAPLDDREAQLEALIRGVPEREPLLARAVEAFDAYQLVKDSDDVDAEYEAMAKYEAAVETVLDTSVSDERLTDVLALKQTEQTRELEALKARHPSYADAIDAAQAAYGRWSQSKGAMEDPSDLKRRIRGAGVLEFRILAEKDSQNPGLIALSGRPVEPYVEQLRKRGPRVKDPGDPFRWFPIKDVVGFTNVRSMEEFEQRREIEDQIIEEYLGTYHVLAHDDPRKYGLTRESGKWELRSATPSQDYQTGRPSVNFVLDARGGKRFGELTHNNIKRQLCIFLDGVAQSHATIQSQIHDRGQITGNFTPQEVRELVNTLEAGSLPARVKETPLMEKTVGPSLGEANRRMGMHAAALGLVVVAAFILVYYLFAGFVANIALALNLLFVLAIMATLEATFTLPGIAGLILTVGMAVDANVLIFERFREERARGVILRKALKTAYEKAFSTIVDANLTTLITCVILGYVGSEEVKGFAMTLGFGVVTSMFTSLFVTRMVFTTLMSARWVTSLRMLRLIGHPSIPWLRLRTVFWPVSVLLVIAGVGIFSYVSATDTEALYDIEFLGGTSVQIELQPDVEMDDHQIRRAIAGDENSAVAWLRSGADALENAKIEAGPTAGEFIVTDPTNTLSTDQMAVLIRTTLEDRLARGGLSGTGNQLVVETKPDVQTDDDGETTETSMTLDEFKQAIVGAEGPVSYARRCAEDRLSGARVQTVRDIEAEASAPTAFEIVTVETNRDLVQTAIIAVLGDKLQVQLPIEAELVVDPNKAPEGLFPIREGDRYLDDVVPGSAHYDIQAYRGGLVLVFDKISPPQTTSAIVGRMREVGLQPEFDHYSTRNFEVIGLTEATVADGTKTYSKVAIVAVDENVFYEESDPLPWREALAEPELEQAQAAFASQKTLRKVLQFDSPIAKRTQTQATVAMILALGAIVAYVWIRFGTMQYGLAAIVALVHDVSITLGLVTVADILGLGEFRIDLPMIAAILTIIGYSLNDTIVVFDRIRENRGKLTVLSPQMIDGSINQCLSRTLLTSITTFVAVFVMFVWGGPGVHGFSFALMIGVIVGTYSSVGVAAPLLNSPRVLHVIIYFLVAGALFGLLAEISGSATILAVGGAILAILLVIVIVIDQRNQAGYAPAAA
ncbi:MAG: protein translocase subunit SecD [Phycisphaerales bacterium]|nr:MAG: protein translocase subunit SecD [Phycisphaerales bacterium]